MKLTRLVSAWLSLAVSSFASTLVFPTDSTPPSWEANVVTGVVGGVPIRTGVLDITQPPYNADNTGVADTVPAYVAALAACASSGGTLNVIYFPDRGPGVPGIYKFLSQVGIPSGITLRGAGVGETHDSPYPTGTTYIRTTQGNCFDINGDPSYGNGVNTTVANGSTDGLTRGSTRIKVGSTAGFNNGWLVRLKIPNDPGPAIPIFGTDRIDSYFRFYTRRITVVDGTHLDVDPAISGDLPFTNVLVQQAVLAPTSGVGVEDMIIDGVNATMVNGINSANFVDSWFQNVKVINHDRHGFLIDSAVHVTVRHCRIESPVVAGDLTSHGGIVPQTLAACLIEDNIVVGNSPDIEDNFGSDTMAVFANYLDKGPGGAYDVHGPYNSYVILEANYAPNVASDGAFGGELAPAYFRNWVSALYNNPNLPVQGFGISLARFTRNPVIVGNILLAPGYPWPANGITLGQPPIETGNGTAQPSVGAWWHDYDTSTHQARLWGGTLTARVDEREGTITLDGSGGGASNLAYSLAHSHQPGFIGINGYNNLNRVQVTSFVGNDVTFHGGDGAGTLPSVGTSMAFIAGIIGFNELDLDVAASAFQKANLTYQSSPPAIISGQELSAGVTLPNSLVYPSGPPAWWTGSWPAYDPFNPTAASVTSTPAGARYFFSIPPSITTASITANGHQIIVSLSKPVVPGAGGNGGWTVSASGVTATFNMISGSTIILDISRVINNDESMTLAYTAPSPAGFEDVNANPLGSAGAFALLNFSTVTPAGQQWFYSAILANADGQFTYQYAGTAYLSPIVIDKPGIITKASVKWGTVRDTDHAFKFGVFHGGTAAFVTNNAGSLIVTPPSPDLPQLFSLNSQHITAGTYNSGVSILANNDPDIITFGSTSGATKGYYSFAYADFPPSNIGSPDFVTNQAMIIGLLLTPDNTAGLHVSGTTRATTVHLP